MEPITMVLVAIGVFNLIGLTIALTEDLKGHNAFKQKSGVFFLTNSQFMMKMTKEQRS